MRRDGANASNEPCPRPRGFPDSGRRRNARTIGEDTSTLCSWRNRWKIRVIVWHCLRGASRSVRSISSITGCRDPVQSAAAAALPGLRPDRVHSLLDRPPRHVALVLKLAHLHVGTVITPDRRVQLDLRHLRRAQDPTLQLCRSSRWSTLNEWQRALVNAWTSGPQGGGFVPGGPVSVLVCVRPVVEVVYAWVGGVCRSGAVVVGLSARRTVRSGSVGSCRTVRAVSSEGAGVRTARGCSGDA